MAKPSSKVAANAGKNNPEFSVSVRVPSTLTTLEGVVKSINSTHIFILTPKSHASGFILRAILLSSVVRFEGEVGKASKLLFIENVVQRPIVGQMDGTLDGTDLIRIVGTTKEGDNVINYVNPNMVDMTAYDQEAPPESVFVRRGGKPKAATKNEKKSEKAEKPLAGAKAGTKPASK